MLLKFARCSQVFSRWTRDRLRPQCFALLAALLAVAPGLPLQVLVQPVDRDPDVDRGLGRPQDQRVLRAVQLLPLGIAEADDELIRIEAGATPSGVITRRLRKMNSDGVKQLPSERPS